MGPWRWETYTKYGHPNENKDIVCALIGSYLIGSFKKHKHIVNENKDIVCALMGSYLTGSFKKHIVNKAIRDDTYLARHIITYQCLATFTPLK